MSKTRRFSQPVATTQQATQVLSQQRSAEDALHRLPLDHIEQDPGNPRHLGFDPRKGTEGIAADDPEREHKLAHLEAVRELAESIQEHGVIQPIQVYEHGERWRIAHGERRYWGAILADQERIPALVRPKPSRLRLHQFIENVQREDLRPDAYLRNVESLISEHEAVVGTPLEGGAGLARVIGRVERHGQRLWRILHTEDVREGIYRGSIPTLKDADQLIQRYPSENARATAIAYLAENGRLPDPPGPKSAETPAKGKRVGRPRKYVSLGRARRPETLRVVIEAVTRELELDEDLRDMDWQDLNEVQALWDRILKRVEGGKGK